ncbi:MAG TPA: hypothetical protein VFC19_36510 [Candidatus Limnocylindrales bacterium]|nr:hypothetical protein [Candidatus Limnocylindrales bacterium]
MGLFDKIKEAAGDLVDGAKDKVSEATGFEADSLIEAGGGFADAAQSVDDAVSSLQEGKLGQ